MATVRTNDENYRAIADAIRERGGTYGTYTPAQMPGAILAIRPNVGEGVATENGLLVAEDEGLEGFSRVRVSVSGAFAHGYGTSEIDMAAFGFESGAVGELDA